MELQASIPVQTSTMATPYLVGTPSGSPQMLISPDLRLQHEVVAGQRRLGSARTVTGDGAAHEPRRILLEPIVA